MASILTLVEGTTDAPYAAAVLRTAGHIAEPLIVKRGHASIDALLPRWNVPGNQRPALVLRDLDPMPENATCTPSAVSALLGGPLRTETLAVRLPVWELESWILADADGVASFFGIRSPVPTDPDALPDPKRTLVELCKRSRLGAVKRGMVPRSGAGRLVGPEYESLVIEFGSLWDPLVAATRSPSLARTLSRFQDLTARKVW